MNRRGFILALGGATAWPLMAQAQQGDRVRRIGWLSPGSGPSDATRSFLQGARERGYLEGENLLVEYRWAAGKSTRLAELAQDLVRAGVELIVAVGTPATLAAKQATSCRRTDPEGDRCQPGEPGRQRDRFCADHR